MKKIIFIGFWPDYEAYFIKALCRAGINAEVFNPLALFNSRLLACIPKPIRVYWFKRLIQKQMAANPSAVFVVHENRIALESLQGHTQKVNAHILMRNIISPDSKTHRCIKSLQQQGYSVWSFDDDDCRKYQFNKYNQFVERTADYIKPAVTHQFGFIGRNKGRDTLLNKLSESFQAQHVSYQFHIKEIAKRPWFSIRRPQNNNVSYESYLATLCSVDCIIDVVQTGQVGLTMRPIEAMLYQKKLLTNSKITYTSDFYNENNILYIADVNALADVDLKAFLEKPFEPIASDIEQKYSLRGLVANIIAELDA